MKKKLILLFAVFFAWQINAQDFYDLETIQTIEITFAQSNWDALLDAEKAGDENYIMAQSISINGVVFDSVGVKYKGNSTYSANQVKNPLHIELDTYKDHDYEGYTDIKLAMSQKIHLSLERSYRTKFCVNTWMLRFLIMQKCILMEH